MRGLVPKTNLEKKERATMKHTWMPKATLIVALVLVAALLAACNGNLPGLPGGPATKAPSPMPPAAKVTAVPTKAAVTSTGAVTSPTTARDRHQAHDGHRTDDRHQAHDGYRAGDGHDRRHHDRIAGRYAVEDGVLPRQQGPDRSSSARQRSNSHVPEWYCRRKRRLQPVRRHLQSDGQCADRQARPQHHDGLRPEDYDAGARVPGRFGQLGHLSDHRQAAPDHQRRRQGRSDLHRARNHAAGRHDLASDYIQ